MTELPGTALPGKPPLRVAVHARGEALPRGCDGRAAGVCAFAYPRTPQNPVTPTGALDRLRCWLSAGHVADAAIATSIGSCRGCVGCCRRNQEERGRSRHSELRRSEPGQPRKTPLPPPVMGNDEPWDVLWTGAYESTAFITALLVGAFSFIPDPTGYQDATDAAEILVYTYWRYAIVVVGLDILFKVIVLVVQWANGVRAYTIVWTLLLMMAPWAPLLNKVVAAVLAWGSVRSLMCNRVTRNEVSCVLREYLRMGDQSLTTAAATEMVVGAEARFGMPSKVLQDAVRRLRDSRSHCESKEYEEKVQTLLKNVENYGISVWMLTRRARRQEPLSRLRGRHS